MPHEVSSYGSHYLWWIGVHNSQIKNRRVNWRGWRAKPPRRPDVKSPTIRSQASWRMRKLSIVGAKSFCDYYCSVDMWKGVWRLRLLAARCSGMLLRPLLLLLKYFYYVTFSAPHHFSSSCMFPNIWYCSIYCRTFIGFESFAWEYDIIGDLGFCHNFSWSIVNNAKWMSRIVACCFYWRVSTRICNDILGTFPVVTTLPHVVQGNKVSVGYFGACLGGISFYSNIFTTIPSMVLFHNNTANYGGGGLLIIILHIGCNIFK